LPSEIVLPEDENWHVGLVHFSCNMKATAAAAAAKYWVCEQDVVTGLPDFVLTATDMINKDYHILIDNSHKAILPQSNYTWPMLVNVITKNFNNANSNISIKFKDNNRVIFQKSGDKTMVLKFSRDFASFLFIPENSISLSSSTQNVILPFTKPAIRSNSHEIMAHGVFKLPEISDQYSIGFSIKKPGQGTQMHTIIIPSGLWNFSEFKKYLNHYLTAVHISVHFPVNYEFSNRTTHFFYGTMQFSNTVNSDDIRVITFDKDIENALKISKTYFEIHGNSTKDFTTEYCTPLLFDDEVINEFTVSSPITYSGLNAQQHTFVFKEHSISLGKPAGKHEYANYKLKLNEYLGNLLGIVSNNWIQLDDGDEYKCSKKLIEHSSIQQQASCLVYTDIIQGSVPSDDQYKLLRHVSASIIYPIIYLKINRSRINNINIKISIGKEAAAIDSAIIVLHFMKQRA
jgi:hypothetical protein